MRAPSGHPANNKETAKRRSGHPTGNHFSKSIVHYLRGIFQKKKGIQQTIKTQQKEDEATQHTIKK